MTFELVVPMEDGLEEFQLEEGMSVHTWDEAEDPFDFYEDALGG